MSKSEYKGECRAARRFDVSWEVAIESAARAGKRTRQAGQLQNLSSRGALFLVPKRVRLGTSLKVEIRVPMKENSWMKYSAKVVRVQKRASDFGVAVNFDTTRPLFTEH